MVSRSVNVFGKKKWVLYRPKDVGDAEGMREPCAGEEQVEIIQEAATAVRCFLLVVLVNSCSRCLSRADGFTRFSTWNRRCLSITIGSTHSAWTGSPRSSSTSFVRRESVCIEYYLVYEVSRS